MKLDSTRIERILDQFDGQAIPDDHPLVPQLSGVFGDHTFFIGDEGLHVVDPVEAAEAEAQAGRVMKVASWSDAKRTSLTPHPAEPTDVVIDFASDDQQA